MFDLKKSEEILRRRAIFYCLNNYKTIRAHYNDLSELKNYVPKTKLTDFFIKDENFDYSDLLSQISNSLISLDVKTDPKTHEDTKDPPNLSNYDLLSLIKSHKLKNVKEKLYTCNINVQNNVKFDFSEYEDGYYDLVYERPDNTTNEVFKPMDSYDLSVENYWKNFKNIPKDEITVFRDIKEEDLPEKNIRNEPETTVRNYNLLNLLPGNNSISNLANENYFYDYYNFNNMKKISVNIGTERQLRQIYIKPRNKEKQLKFGLLTKGNNKDLILKRNENNMNEYLVVFDEDSMEVYESETLEGQVSSEKHLQKSCIRKFFASEIVRENLRNKLILKLKRHQNARVFTAKDMKKNADQINKSISSVTLGCFWCDWNFYGGGIVPEVHNEELSTNPTEYLLSLEKNDLYLLTTSFIESLQVRGRSLETFEDIFSVISEIVKSYRTLVMGNFNEDYLEIMKKSFLELKTKSTPSDIALLTPDLSELSVSSASSIDRDSVDVDSELNSQREQVLPTFNKYAKTVEELTNLRQMVSFLLTDYNDVGSFVQEPFVDLSTIPKIKNVSKTVINCSKSITKRSKNPNLKETEIVLSALKILDLLIFLLQKSSKSFNSARDFHSFITNSKYEFESYFSSSMFNYFYERSNDSYSIKVLGSKRLMCYVIWLCIYLSPKYTFDFSFLLNYDLTNVSNSILFNSCVDLTSITPAGRTNKNLYKINTPLFSGSKKMNLTSLVTNKTKRFKLR
uniref:Uncharacterized protein n=1 Tax=Theileria annulata TaxID=5874 RepID=A0A3B0MGG9_THEAN